MKVELLKKPKNPIIIEGFPGFGLVGSISTEFLINHLQTEQIGSIKVEENSPLVAIHDGKVLDPIAIHYNKKNNIIIVHAIASSQGIEWQLKETILKLAKDLQAKEIISLEGVIGGEAGEPRSFYFTNSAKSEKKFETSSIEKLKEGIVVGVTGALLLEKSVSVSAVFVETHSAMPDSKAAAKVIEILDKYLGLEVDYAPLLKQAELFEKKLKTILQQKNQIVEEQEKKKMSYIS
ncbi:PAC2 family protein [Candidatus Woesearchaeota archaeon]|nr:PAC2 family protein [Candidatus Woesearchaeota archaeon]